jgi:DNA anti-recombination protein RmuC
MADKGDRYWDRIVGLLVVLLLAGGCHHETTPETKQSRLIAAESMQLKKQLADCHTRIETLNARHADALERCEDELDACQKRIEVLQEDLRQGVAERVNSVTTTVLDENAGLRQEIQRLQAELDKLKSRLLPLP